MRLQRKENLSKYTERISVCARLAHLERKTQENRCGLWCFPESCVCFQMQSLWHMHAGRTQEMSGPEPRLVFAADKTLWTLTPEALWGRLKRPWSYLVHVLWLEVEFEKTLFNTYLRVQGQIRICEQGHLHLRNKHCGNNYQRKLFCEYFMIRFRHICLSLWRASRWKTVINYSPLLNRLIRI